MVRVDIEPNREKAGQESWRREVKREIGKELFRSELRGKFGRFGRKIGCCFFLLVVLLGLLVAGAAVLNKTGLVKIPIIAEIFP